MQINFQTDNTIVGFEQRTADVTAVVSGALDRFASRVTRVEVHVSDQNGRKSGLADIRCVIEARLERRKPVAVSHDAASIALAVDGATDKLVKVLERTLAAATAHRG